MDLMTVFVALLGPAGIWFGWFLQGRHRKADLADKRAELLRHKAEEALAEIQKVSDRSRSAVIDALQGVHGLLPIDHRQEAAGNLLQLSVLIQLYFPDVFHLVAAHDDEIYPLMVEHQKAITDVPDEGTPAALKQCRELVLAHQLELNAVTIRTLPKIRAEIIAHVRPLIVG